MKSAEQLVCDALRGKAADWPGTDSLEECSRFIERLQYHGVAVLVDWALDGSGARGSWPPAVRDHCRTVAREQAIIEMASRAELATVLAALSESGAKALLLKGTALAYSHYDSPVQRPRGDTDLLIPPSARPGVEAILRRLGYARDTGVPGDFIISQSPWTRTDGLGVVHELDIHWRINNSQVLAGLLDYVELEARATELAELCANAWAPAPVHALLFACLHRSGHRNAPYYVDGIAHPASDRLIWLYDIHLLVSRLSEGDLEEFTVLAARKRMKALCRDSLARTAELFDTPIPARVMDALAPSGPEEPSARYCRAGRASQMVDDFLALGTLRSRARWLGELAFPPGEYMRAKYEGAMLSWLPLLYARRAARGLRQLVS